MNQSQSVGVMNLQKRQAHGRLLINGRAYELRENQSIVGRMANTSARRPDIDLQHLAQSQTISREHLRIEWDGNNHYLFCIKDSPNKVYLNNQQLYLNQRNLLMHGDIIVFGEILAVFECLAPHLRLPEPENPYVRLRWIGTGATYYVHRNPGFIGRGRKKYFPHEFLAFDFENETRDILSLSRPHAKFWMESDGRVFIKNLKPDALVVLDGKQVTDIVEVSADCILQLALLEFHIQLMA